jgi:hypothetical protein
MTSNKILLVFALIFSTFASAQVGIGTQNPQGIFNIDGAKNNATSGAPTAAQQNDDFVVTAAGNVGIGLTTPTNKLDVRSAASSLYVSLASFYAPNNTTSGNNTLLNFGVGASQGNAAQFRFVYTGSDAATNRVDFGMDGYVTPFVTYTRIGNVGIGTTAPTQKLDVNGNVKFSGALMPGGIAGTAGQVLTSAGAGATPVWAAAGGGSASTIYTTDDALTANRTVTQDAYTLKFDGTASTGGSTTINNGSGARLNIAAKGTTLGTTGRAALTLSTPNSGTLSSFIDDGSVAQIISSVAALNMGTGTGNTNNLTLRTNGTAAMTILGSNQNVGIGTASPTEKLQVFGGNVEIGGLASQTGSVANPMLRIHSNANTNGSGGLIEFNEDSVDYGYTLRHNTGNGAYGNEGLWFETKVNNVYTPRFGFNDNGNVGIGTTTPSARLVVQGTTGNGVLKLIAPSVAAGDNWWMGFGHGTTSTDANDRARIGVNILGGGQGRLFFTTGFAGSQVNAMFIDESQRVGIGTTAPSEKLEVAGKTKTTNFQMTNGAANNFILTSDASGNGTWKNAQEILVNKISVTPPVGTTANYTIPCDATYDIIQITNENANFATIITLPTPACAFAGQKVKIISTATSEATISKTNTNTYGTTLLNTGDVYEFTFSNGKWELTSFPTRNRDFCNAPNNSATTLVNPTTPKTVFYFYNGCWNGLITLPAGGTLGDVLIIDDKATLDVVIKQDNTTLAADFTLVTGSYVQFIKTNLGWVKQF